MRKRHRAARYLCRRRYQEDAALSAGRGRGQRAAESLHSYPITLSRVALHNVNVKIDDTAVSVRDFSTGLNWQEKNLTLTPTSLQGLLIALPKVAKVAQEQVVEPKIDNPQPQEKPLGETMTDLFSQPVLPAMTDVHLPLNLNIQAFRGEQLRLTGDTDITVYNLLLKVSSIDGQMKLDALDIDSDQGKVSASGSAQLQDNWPVDIPSPEP